MVNDDVISYLLVQCSPHCLVLRCKCKNDATLGAGAHGAKQFGWQAMAEYGRAFHCDQSKGFRTVLKIQK